MNHGYIFDCYGTLVHPISNTGAKEFLKLIDSTQRGERIHRLMTSPVSIQEHLHTQDFHDITNHTKSHIVDLLQSDTTTLYDDAQRMIEHCISQDIPFCILSNLSADYKDNVKELIIDPYYRYYDRLFKVLFSCDIGYKKPEIQAYELTIKFLQQQDISKENMIMIGDNLQYDYHRPKEFGLQAKRIQRKSMSTDRDKSKIIRSFDKILS